MSSQKPKKNRACDSCRRRKSRCNGADVPNGRCATCIIHSVECTYNDPPLARTPRHTDRPPAQKVSSKTYAKALEARISNLEQLIQRCEREGASRTSQATRTSLAAGDDEPEDHTELRARLDPLSSGSTSQRTETVPLSSSEEVVDDDVDRSFMHSGQDRDKSLPFGLEYDPLRAMQTWNTDFWNPPEWLVPVLKSPAAQFEFPETSLVLHLVDCYFDNLDLVLPLLHRPSFTRSVVEGLHEADRSFGATVLLVCAIGCRYTNHPGIVHELSTSTPCTAWSFYNQANRVRKAPYLPHSLYEVQIYPLSVLFLESYSPPETAWLTIGMGLRIMQNNGVHRKSSSKKPTIENELWKRAFWVSVVLDRAFSTLLGRACVLQDEDFDADLPVICNDEDLDDCNPSAPIAVDPTRMRCFVAAIQLNQILAFALRTIYSTRKSRVILGYGGKRWEKYIVATLDSALNKWVDTVPEELRLDSKVPKKCRAEVIQSVFLWTQFYEIQLHIHRMFALRELSDPELCASSMIICKNASKQCIAIMESAKDVMMIPFHCFLLIKSVFTSTVFLLLMFWKKKGIDHGSPEFSAIEAGVAMVGQTVERRSTSLHLLDIARVLREAVDRSGAGGKVDCTDFFGLKFKGVRYIGQDGTLSDGARGGKVGAKVARANEGAVPRGTEGLMWDHEQEPANAQSSLPGLDGVSMADYNPNWTANLLPEDIFADTSFLFTGPSTTGFVRIGDKGLPEGTPHPTTWFDFLTDRGSERSQQAIVMGQGDYNPDVHRFL